MATYAIHSQNLARNSSRVSDFLKFYLLACICRRTNIAYSINKVWYIVRSKGVLQKEGGLEGCNISDTEFHASVDHRRIWLPVVVAIPDRDRDRALYASSGKCERLSRGNRTLEMTPSWLTDHSERALVDPARSKHYTDVISSRSGCGVYYPVSTLKTIHSSRLKECIYATLANLILPVFGCTYRRLRATNLEPNRQYYRLLSAEL